MYVMVQVDGDVVCSAWMVLRGMAPRTMYANNRFWYVRVHGMALVLGMGRGGWWCCTPVVTGEHSRHGTVHSSMRPHSGYMQVHSGPLGGGPRRPWGRRIHMGTTGVGWVPRCTACWWRRVDMEDSTHNALTGRVSEGHFGMMLWHMWEAVHTIHRTLLRGWPWRVPCVRRCADAAGDASANPLHQNSNGCGRKRWPNVRSTWCPCSRPQGWSICHVFCPTSSSGNAVVTVGRRFCGRGGSQACQRRYCM